MSRREVKFRHSSGPMLVICDVCDVAKKDAGAVRVERSDHAGPYIQTICDECAIEISHAMIRRYVTPDALEPPTSLGEFSKAIAEDERLKHAAGGKK